MEVLKPNFNDFSQTNCRYSLFFIIPKTDVGTGIGFKEFVGYQFGISVQADACY